MIVDTGKVSCTGGYKKVTLGYRPKNVFYKLDAAQRFAWADDTLWCNRSNVFHGADSFNDGIRIVDDGFVIGTNAIVNAAGGNGYWLALTPESKDENLYETQSWLGNAAARTINLPSGKAWRAAIIKRDSALAAAVKFAGFATAEAAGNAITDCITSLSNGSVTLTSETNVNEYNSAGGIGEGINGLFFGDSVSTKVVTYTGDGVAGRSVDLGIAADAVFAFRLVSGGGSGRFITKDMAGGSAPMAASALIANEGALSGNSLVIGSTATTLNASGVTYGVIAFSKANNTKVLSAPAIKIKNSNAVYLPGRSILSYIACGSSDATLKITGAITLEWCGLLLPDTTTSGTNLANIMTRGDGPFGTAAGYSWAMSGVPASDGAFNWPGYQFGCLTKDLLGYATPLDTNGWRTGILIPRKFCHAVFTHNGSGKWNFYLNGALVKQRDRDVTVNINSVAGHPTVIGARSSSGSMVQAQRMLHKVGRVYAAELTAAQVLARYNRVMLGSTIDADVTTGLAANWDADNASSTSLPDTVNSANNGTINNGQILIL